MKRLLCIVALLGMSCFGMNLMAQQTPSSTPSTPAQSTTPNSTTSSQTSATTPGESARSFEGKITKSGDEYVLQDSATSTSYKLDDQSKAKEYEGKNVKVMATMDPSNNTLHVVDITPSKNR
ncbi:MAG TPA: DUF5818 domain-containing protein [Candidatus Sulfotelmatobacter sp.]|nr:DUF5818 domain-containing protein [Candidatus Sulfotelmatobacter sp.]